jgi:hypothetical protein
MRIVRRNQTNGKAGKRPACRSARVLVLAAALAAAARGQAPAPLRPAVATSGVTPFVRGEVLNYAVNWPSGLSLGEAQFKAGGGEPGWDFEFTLDASLPGFEIRDRYVSSADAQFCSIRLQKEVVHGVRKFKETVIYDQKKHQASRETSGGGKSDLPVPDCVKDALTFFYFLRRDLANGRVPLAQTINFGAPYQVTTTYGNASQIEIGGARQPADRVLVSYRGPASSQTFEIFFGRDPARTPLVIRVPFSLGTFALELVR